VAALYLPALNKLLGTRALTGTEVGLACLAAIPGYLVARFDRRRTERRHARDGERLRAEAGTGTGTGQDGERR
jgi:hypothetical protein